MFVFFFWNEIFITAFWNRKSPNYTLQDWDILKQIEPTLKRLKMRNRRLKKAFVRFFYWRKKRKPNKCHYYIFLNIICKVLLFLKEKGIVLVKYFDVRSYHSKSRVLALCRMIILKLDLSACVCFSGKPLTIRFKMGECSISVHLNWEIGELCHSLNSIIYYYLNYGCA